MWKFLISLRSNQGFTLMESLLALMVNAMVLMLVGALLQTIYQAKSHFDDTDKNVEWHVFLNQVENDVADKTLLRIQTNEVKLSKINANDTITYAPWGATVRRYRDGEGYVPMITKVRNTIFKSTKNGFSIETHFINGQIMKGSIPIAPKKE